MKGKNKNNPDIQNPDSKIQNQGGTLYIVSTPIGNLEDITLRALRTLKEVDLIAAESVGHSKGLCRHYGIRTRLTGYNQHNHRAKGRELLKKLKSGADIALVTSAGTPTVSDPGGLLIDMAIEEKVRVSPVPGPSAVTAALAISGLKSDRFVFLGFLSNRAGKRRKELRNLAPEARSLVLFEAPHRIKGLLEDILDILGDRRMALIREMTKVYEEVKRGPVSTLLEGFGESVIKGEFTLVVAGNETGSPGKGLDARAQNTIKTLLTENGMGIREIATRLSGEEGLPYRAVYKECISIKRDLER